MLEVCFYFCCHFPPLRWQSIIIFGDTKAIRSPIRSPQVLSTLLQLVYWVTRSWMPHYNQRLEASLRIYLALTPPPPIAPSFQGFPWVSWNGVKTTPLQNQCLIIVENPLKLLNSLLKIGSCRAFHSYLITGPDLLDSMWLILMGIQPMLCSSSCPDVTPLR